MKRAPLMMLAAFALLASTLTAQSATATGLGNQTSCTSSTDRSGCRSRDVDEPAKAGPSPLVHTLWKWSLVAYGTANALDVASSVGPHYGHETNSLLTNSTGNFDAGRAIAVKGSVFAATGIAEYLIIRKWPQLTKLFSIVNFGWTAGEAGVAAHNFTLRK